MTGAKVKGCFMLHRIRKITDGLLTSYKKLRAELRADLERLRSPHLDETFRFPLLWTTAFFWLIAVCIAGPVIATFGLYDYGDTYWHMALQLVPPILLLWVLIKKWDAVKRLWALLSPLRDYRKALIGQTVVFSLLLGGAVWFLGAGRNVHLCICNVARYDILTAVNYKTNRHQWRTDGYWRLAPGECKERKFNFLRVEPKLYISAVKKDELEAWLDGEDVTWDFDQNETLTWLHGSAVPAGTAKDALSQKLQGEEIAWESAGTRCVGKSLSHPSGAAHYTDASDNCSSSGREKHLAHFVELPYSFEKSDRYDVWFMRGGRNVTLEVCNILPYRSAVALHYRSKRAEWRTDAPYTFSPGECKPFELNFQRVEPELYMHQSISGYLEKWHLNSHGAPDEWRTTAGERDYAGRLLPYVVSCSGSQDRAVNDYERLQDCREGETPRPFVLVQRADETQVLSTPALPVPSKADGTVDLEKAKFEAQALRESLVQRMLHRIRWPKGSAKPIPYLIGIQPAAEDHYGEYFRGVFIQGVLTPTPFGARVPVQAGEEIVEFDGKPVFSIEDLRRALVVFAESTEKGIMNPYSVKVISNGREITRWGWFYFNEAAFERSEYERQAAYEWGSSAGWSFFGDPVKRRCAGDPDKNCVWKKTQEFWRLRQLYPSEFNNGEFLSSALQSIATIVVLGPLARALRWLLGLAETRAAVLASEVLVGSTLGAAEFATLAAVDAPPGSDVHREVREAAKLGAKIGFASVLLSPAKAKLRPAR